MSYELDRVGLTTEQGGARHPAAIALSEARRAFVAAFAEAVTRGDRWKVIAQDFGYSRDVAAVRAAQNLGIWKPRRRVKP